MLSHILKDDALKVLHSICQQIGKLSNGHRTGKGQLFIPISKKGNAKECSNYHTISLTSHASKVMLHILQARFQQYMHCEFPDLQAGFSKGIGTRDQIANICGFIEKSREFQKTSISASLTTLKPLALWITKNCRKFFKRWEYQTWVLVPGQRIPDLPPEKSVYRWRGNN